MAVLTRTEYSKTANFDVLNLGEPITVVNLTPTHTANVTQYPLESGAFVSDHMQLQPVTISVRAMVGNLMLDPQYKSEKGTAAWEKLVDLQKTAETVDLITDLGSEIYKNMVITSLSAPRNATVGNSVVFEMEMQQVMFAESVSQAFNPPPPDNPGEVGDGDSPTGDRQEDDNRGEIGAVDDPSPDPPVRTGGSGGGGIGDHRRRRDRDDLDDDFELRLDGPDGTAEEDDPIPQRDDSGGVAGVQRIRPGIGIQVLPDAGIGEVTISTLPDEFQIPDGGHESQLLRKGEGLNTLEWSDVLDTPISFELGEKFLALEAQTSSNTDADPLGVWEIRTDQGADKLDFMRFVDDLHTSYVSLNHFTQQIQLHKPARFHDAAWIHGGVYFDHEPNPLPNPASGQSLLFGNPSGDPVWHPHGGTARNLMPAVPATDGKVLTSQGGQPSWQPATNPDTAYPIALNDSFEISLDFADTDFQLVENTFHLLDARRVPTASSGDENKILTVDNGLPTWQRQLTGGRTIRIATNNELWVRYNNLHFTAHQDTGLELSFLQAIPLLTRYTRDQFLTNTGTALAWADIPVYTAGSGLTLESSTQFGALVNQQDLIIGGSGIELQPNRRIPNAPTDAVRHQLEFNGTGLEWTDLLIESVSGVLGIDAKDLRLNFLSTDFQEQAGSLQLNDDKRLPALPSDSVSYVLTSTNESLAWGSPAVTNPIEVNAGSIGFHYSTDDFAVSEDGLELHPSRRLPDTPEYTVPRYLVQNQSGLEWVSNLFPETTPPIRVGSTGRIYLDFEGTDFVSIGQRLQLHPHQEIPTPPQDNQTKVLVTNNRSYSWGSQAVEAPIAVNDSNEIKLKYSSLDFANNEHGYLVLQETQRLPALPPSNQRNVYLKATSSRFEWVSLPPPAVGGALSIDNGNVILNFEPLHFIVSSRELQLHPFREIPNPPASSTPHFLRSVSQNYSWQELPHPTASVPITVTDDGEIELLLDRGDFIVFNNRLTLSPIRKYPTPPDSTTPHYLSTTSTNGFQWLTKPVSDVDLPLDVNNNRIQLRYVSTDFVLESDRLSLQENRRLPNAPTPYTVPRYLQQGQNGMSWVAKPNPDVTTPLAIGDDGVELNINTLQFQIANGQLELNPSQQFPTFPIGSDLYTLQLSSSSLSWVREYARLPELPAGTESHALRSANSVLSWTRHYADLPELPSEAGDKFLQVNGATLTWETLPEELPSAPANTNPHTLRITNSTLSWTRHYADLPELPSEAGDKFLQVNGATLTWETLPAQIPAYDDQIAQFILSVNADGDLAWRRETGQLYYSSGAGISIDSQNNQISVVRPVPTGGTVGQALRVSADGTALEWADVSTQMISYLAGDGLSLDGTTFNVTNPLPTDGVDGYYLRRTATGYRWAENIELFPGSRDGQVLSRNATHIIWADKPIGLPDGGTDGQVLKRTSSGYEWQTFTADLPEGGTDNQVLKRTSTGYAWEDPYQAGNGIRLSWRNFIHVERPVPGDGRLGQLLVWNLNGEPAWAGPITVGPGLSLSAWWHIGLNRPVPSGGNEGEVLRIGAGNGLEWASITGSSSGGSNSYTAGTGIAISSSNVISVSNPLPAAGNNGQSLQIDHNGNIIWRDPLPYTFEEPLYAIHNYRIGIRRAIPAGGETGQLLARTETGYAWTTPSQGVAYGAGAGLTLNNAVFSVDRPIPGGGNAGQILSRTSSGYQWINQVAGGTDYLAGTGLTLNNDTFNIDLPVPQGGSQGQVLTRLASGIGWTTISTGATYTGGLGLTLVGNEFNVDRPIPTGGTAGQLLGLNSSGLVWITPAQGTVYQAGIGLTLSDDGVFNVQTPLPSGGSDGQILARSSGSIVWINPTDENTEYTAGDGLDLSADNRFSVQRIIPAGGNAGQLLARTADGYTWSTPSQGTVYSAGTGLSLSGAEFSVDIPLPALGSDGQILGIDSGVLVWINPADEDTTYTPGTGVNISQSNEISVVRPVPSGGSVGQFLRRTSSGYEWAVPIDTNTDTTYQAGAGLSLSGTEFSVTNPFPTGGTSGQLLSRTGNGYAWINPAEGVVYSAGLGLSLNSGTEFVVDQPVPSGGSQGQVLSRQGTTGLSWINQPSYSAGSGLVLSPTNVFSLEREIPAGGSTNQYLRNTGSGYEWATIADQDTTYTVGGGLSLSDSNQITIDDPIPSGGSEHQVLTRLASGFGWRDVPSYIGGDGLTLTASNRFNIDRPVPSGGTAGQVLTVGNTGLTWETPQDENTLYSAGSGLTLSPSNRFDVARPIPTGGASGEFLMRTALGYTWGTPTDSNDVYSAGTGLDLSASNQFSVTDPIPAGGSENQVLTKLASGFGWADLPDDQNTEYTAGQGLSLSPTNELRVTIPVPSGGQPGQILVQHVSEPDTLSWGTYYSWHGTISLPSGVRYNSAIELMVTAPDADDSDDDPEMIPITVPDRGRVSIVVDHGSVCGEVVVPASILRVARSGSNCAFIPAGTAFAAGRGVRFYCDTDNHLQMENTVDAAQNLANTNVIISFIHDGFYPSVERSN